MDYGFLFCIWDVRMHISDHLAIANGNEKE